MKNTWKTISEALCNAKYKKSVIHKIIKNKTELDSPQDIAEEFNNYFVNIGPDLSTRIKQTPNENFKSYMKKQITSSFNFELITIQESQKVVDSLKSKTSSGHDNLSVSLLKYIAPLIIKPITLVINQSLTTGIFPQKLKIAKVLPLFKKGDDSIMGNYRPISLLSSISKWFEKVVFNQIYDYFTKNKLFFPNQYGFRKKHSTDMAAVELIDRAMHQIDQGKCALSVFMDLSKAFDTLNHDIMCKKLKFYGICGTSLKWFNSYLTSRTQYVDINGHCSKQKYITTGVPQGSILGPLLFIIYMNDIPACSEAFNFILYADDTSLFAALDISEDNFSQFLNIELDRVYEWLCCNKLSLNLDKTKFMFFHHHKKNIFGKVPVVKINNKMIERVQNFNFLGIIINENLNWKSHCDYIANKLTKINGIMNILKNVLPFFIMKTIYFSMFQSHLMYGLLLWGYNCNRVFKLQKRALRVITKSKYNSHTEPLFKYCKILKLSDLLRLSTLKFYYKFKHGDLPAYFESFSLSPQGSIHAYPTRSGSQIRSNFTRTMFADKCLRNYIPCVINSTSIVLSEKIRVR